MQINQIKNFLLGLVEDNEKSVLEFSEEVLTQSPPILNDALILSPCSGKTNPKIVDCWLMPNNTQWLITR